MRFSFVSNSFCRAGINTLIFRSLLACLTAAGLLTITTPAHAETFEYHPSAAISLGEPYDEMFPGESLIGNGIFAWSRTGYDQQSGVNAVTFSYREISNFSELSKSLSIDANAEASFVFGDSAASVQYDRFLKKSKNEIVIAITAYREYKPRKKRGNLTLSERGKELLTTAHQQNQLHLWRQIAGSDVIVETVSGHQVSLFYRFSTSDSSKLEALRTAVATEWSSGSANANIVNVAKNIDSSVSVSIDYEQAGGAADVAAIEALLAANNGDVAAIRNAMAIALRSADRDDARILRFNTVKVANMPDVVFGASGSYQQLADYYKLVRTARATHFERLLTAQTRQYGAQRLLDEKPDNLFVNGGKTALTTYRDQLASVITGIRAEYDAYNMLNPADGAIATNAGATIPVLSPTRYFKAPYVQLTEWVQTPGSAARCGWGSYDDCEFHDFEVAFYPKFQFTLPEFVARIRFLEKAGNNCNPITTARRNDIQSIMRANGSFSDFYRSRYTAHKVYTWGANHMPGAFNNWKRDRRNDESAKRYLLEVTTTDETRHYIDLGAIGSPVGPANALIDYDAICST